MPRRPLASVLFGGLVALVLSLGVTSASHPVAPESGDPAAPGGPTASNSTGWKEAGVAIGGVWPAVSTAQQGDESRGPAPIEDEGYEPPRIEFLQDLTPQRKDEVRALVGDVVDFFYERLGVRASGLTIRYGDRSQSACGIYTTEGHTITIAHPDVCFPVIPHEYVHALQGQLRERTHLGPPWIVEGSADYWSAVYYDDTGDEEYVNELRAVVRQAEDLGFIPAVGGYSVGHLAVHYLVKRGGEKALVSYFQGSLEPSRDGWNRSFLEAFGLDLNEFYIAFARFWASMDDSVACPSAWYEPGTTREDSTQETCRRLEGVVTDLDGNPRGGVYVEATTRLDNRYLGEGSAFALTNGEGRFSLELSEATHWIAACVPVKSRLRSPCFGTTTRLPGVYSNGTRVDLQSEDVTDVVIRTGLVAGTVLGRGGEPLRGIGLQLLVPWEGGGFSSDGEDFTGYGRVSLARGQTSADGRFHWLVPRGVYRMVVFCNPGGFAGWYGGSSGLTSLQSESTAITVDTADINDIVIKLPVTSDEAGWGSCVAAE